MQINNNNLITEFETASRRDRETHLLCQSGSYAGV